MRKVRYTFDMIQPVNQDIHLLLLKRYEWDDADPPNGRGFVLTNNGWREFQPFDMLDNDLPSISGLDMCIHDGMKKEMAEWTKQVREMLRIKPPTEHFCQYKQALCELYEWARDADYEGSGDFGDLFERLPDLTGNPTNFAKADDA